MIIIIACYESDGDDENEIPTPAEIARNNCISQGQNDIRRI